MQAFAEALQFGDALRGDRRRHLAGQVDGRRPGTLREGKDMQESGFESRQKIVRRAEIGLRLAREPDDHVDADEGVGHQRPHGGDAVGETRRGIAAAHQSENFVRAALERNMEVMLEFR